MCARARICAESKSMQRESAPRDQNESPTEPVPAAWSLPMPTLTVTPEPPEPEIAIVSRHVPLLAPTAVPAVPACRFCDAQLEHADAPASEPDADTDSAEAPLARDAGTEHDAEAPFDEGFSFEHLSLAPDEMRALVPVARRLLLRVGARVVCMDLYEIYQWLRTNPRAHLEGGFGRCALSDAQRQTIVARAESLLAPEQRRAQQLSYQYYEPTREELLQAAHVDDYALRPLQRLVQQNDAEALAAQRDSVSNLGTHDRVVLLVDALRASHTRCVHVLAQQCNALRSLDAPYYADELRRVLECALHHATVSCCMVLLRAVLREQALLDALTRSASPDEPPPIEHAYQCVIERGEEYLLEWLYRATGHALRAEHLLRATHANRTETALYLAAHLCDVPLRDSDVTDEVVRVAIEHALSHRNVVLVRALAVLLGARLSREQQQRMRQEALSRDQQPPQQPQEPPHDPVYYAQTLQTAFVRAGHAVSVTLVEPPIFIAQHTIYTPYRESAASPVPPTHDAVYESNTQAQDDATPLLVRRLIANDDTDDEDESDSSHSTSSSSSSTSGISTSSSGASAA